MKYRLLLLSYDGHVSSEKATAKTNKCISYIFSPQTRSLLLEPLFIHFTRTSWGVMIGQLPKPAAVVVGRVSFIPMGFYTLGLKYVKQPPTASVVAADDTQCCLGRADKHHLQLRGTSLMWLEVGEDARNLSVTLKSPDTHTFINTH